MISLILMIVAGFLNACMDAVSFKWYTCIFNKCNANWFDPARSWSNKWKKTVELWNDGKRKERFFGSSTFLVFLTDFWHLCKFLTLLCIAFAIIFYNPLVNWWVDILIMYCSFTISFELFFSKILLRKKNI